MDDVVPVETGKVCLVLVLVSIVIEVFCIPLLQCQLFLYLTSLVVSILDWFFFAFVVDCEAENCTDRKHPWDAWNVPECMCIISYTTFIVKFLTSSFS
jgi:hypothetical protein